MKAPLMGVNTRLLWTTFIILQANAADNTKDATTDITVITILGHFPFKNSL